MLADSSEGRLRGGRSGFEAPQSAPASPPGKGASWFPFSDCSLHKEHLSGGEASAQSFGLGGGKAVRGVE